VKAFLILFGSMSLRHGASPGCGWKIRPPDMEVAGNITNKQSLTADKGWSCCLWGLSEGLKLRTVKKNSLLRNVTQGFGIGRILWDDLGNGKRI
jgi:hypothetical protein